MSRTGILLALAVSLALTSAPSAAAKKPFDSWGRAGVDFETYRNDSVECASAAYYADVSETEQAKAFVRGTKRMEATDGMPLDNIELARRYAQIEHSVRPELRVQQLREGLQQVVDNCLVERGYLQFRLTDGQREELSKLKKGTPERHRFLYQLASDPQVLQTQAVPVEAG